MRRVVSIAGLLLLLFAIEGYATQFAQPTSTSANTAEYDLSLRVLPSARRLEVAGRLRLPPMETGGDKIELLLSSRMTEVSMRLLEPVRSEANVGLTNDGASGDTKWTLRPSVPIPAGASVVILFSYKSDGTSAPQFNISPDGSLAGGGGEFWYPQTAYENRETGRLRFTVPGGETVISNGALESTPEQTARGEFIFRVTQPSKFGFAGGRYMVMRRAGRVPFNIYLLRPRAQAQTILDGSARALEFLTDLFGEFPYREFSFVEVNFPTVVLGTGEFGFILADDSKLDEFDLAFWAHEMGHQWWGNLLRSAPNTTGRMMLSEGVTQFGALLAVEAVEGQAAAEQFRRNGYRGRGQSAAAYFRLARAGTDFPITLHNPQNQNKILTLHRLVNTKGFILLDMLSRQVGRARFAAILRRFVRRNANRTTSWQEFQRTIEAEAGRDVRWFFEQWFERTGAPDYQLTWRQEGRTVHSEVTQLAPLFRATLEVEIVGGNRRVVKSIEVGEARTSFAWQIPFRAERVILDPHYKVLRWLPEFRAQANP